MSTHFRSLSALCASLLLFLPASALADDYATTLAKIVEASRPLAAARSLADAEIAENATGLNLENPELEFSYQWGQPGYVPDKKTVDVSQSFDFATLSGAKRRLALAKNKLASSGVSSAARDVASEADEIMTDIAFRSRLAAHYDSALMLVRKIYDAAEASRKKGNMTIVDVNSIRMEYNALISEARLNQIELDANFSSLKRIAAGAPISWRGDAYLDYHLPADFSAWLASVAPQNANLAMLRAQSEVAEKEIELRRKENLPSFSAGFTSEIVKDANYYGVALGVELPLWANSGRVKAARAAHAAAVLDSENALQEYEIRLRSLYDKAIVLRNLVDDTRRLRDECDIRPGLAKLFSAGQLSVHDYLSQLQPLIDLDKRMLEAEHDYQVALTEFRAATR